ncbi:MAG TPA: hypothetical protein VGN16_08245 [Acidobacteriaceae bacterium]|jgi:hypothetical protein
MPGAVEFRYQPYDMDMSDVTIRSSNGFFSGSAELYVSPGEPVEAASALRAFPASNADRRELVFGAFGSDSAGGAVRLEFFVRDLAGHVSVKITMEDAGNRGYLQEVVLGADFEPSALDVFVAELSMLNGSAAGIATLALL